MVFFTYFLTKVEGKCLGRCGIFKTNKISSFAFKHFLQPHHYAFLPTISQNTNYWGNRPWRMYCMHSARWWVFCLFRSAALCMWNLAVSWDNGSTNPKCGLKQLWLSISREARPCSWVVHSSVSPKPQRPDETLLLNNILCKPCLQAGGWWTVSLCQSISWAFRNLPGQRVAILLTLPGFKDWKQCVVMGGVLTKKLEKNREFLVCLGGGRILPRPFGNWV